MSTAPADRFTGWRMVALAFLAQNCTVGLLYGSYGTIVAGLEQQLGMSRAQASTGMGVMLLVLGLLSPVVGSLLQRMSLRTAMIAGVVINAAAYFLLSRATSFLEFLLLYGVLGLGMSTLGIIAPSTLISRWFISGRALALSIVNTPLFLFIVPAAAAWISARHGADGILLCAAGLLAALLPLLLLVVDRPEQLGQRPHGAGEVAPVAGQSPIPAGSFDIRRLLVNRPFWMLSLAVAVVGANGTVFVVHIVPFAMAENVSLQSAAFLLSAYGGAGIIGTLICGWVADRVGALHALAAMSVCMALIWIGLVVIPGYAGMIVLAALYGAMATSIIALHGAAINELFGAENISRVMGLSYFVKLPFIFGAAPLAGHLYDVSRSYDLAFLLCAAGFLAAAAVFATMILAGAQRFPRYS